MASHTPPLAVEFHYEDGDVGVHPVLPGSHEETLWLETTGRDSSHTATHIIIRRDDDGGQELSNRLMASGEALRACDLLISAYAVGEDSGGSIEWYDVDMAHESARVATTIATTGAAGIRRDCDESVCDEPSSAEIAKRPQDDAATLQIFLDDLETAMKALSPHLSEAVLSSMNEQLLREYGAAYLTRLKNAGS